MHSGQVRRLTYDFPFGAAIKAARIQSGLTQFDIAEETGLPVHVIRRIEQGVQRINLSEAAAIAEALGCSLDELVELARLRTFEPLNRGQRRSIRC